MRVRHFLTVALLALTVTAQAADYRIGYFQARESSIFSRTLDAIKTALRELQWQDKVEFPDDAQYFLSAGQQDQWRPAAEALMARQDLDLVIVAGTDAGGEILAVNNGRTPILATAVSDPVRSGFVTDEHDSGIDNFTVSIEPERYLNMFRVFHEEVRFKRLGLLYEDTDNGRKYANVEDAESVAKERGFDLVHYKIAGERTPRQCMKALETLVAKKIDAFYMPSLTCFEWPQYDVEKYLNYLTAQKIAVFARQGSEDVQAGALMGFSSLNYRNRGHFTADRLIRILQGAKPRDLDMIDDAKPLLTLNLYVAQKIDFQPSFKMIGNCDDIYQTVKLPENRLSK